MLALHVDKLRTYLSTLFESDVEVHFVKELGAQTEVGDELKGFGYGVPYLIRFSTSRGVKNVVFETMRPEGFGHDHFSDRAGTLLWQHSTFNNLPKHIRSVDVGAFNRDSSLKSLGGCEEFFIITEYVEGRPYSADLDRIKGEKQLNTLDRDRCSTLSNYIAAVHSEKLDAPSLYHRRIRDLIGHGECIMGLCDSYPPSFKYVSSEKLCLIEKKCVDWRWKLKGSTHRLSQVHGDYHPWNILFRKDLDFNVLDRSRGEWGEPADDVTAMTINYIFYSLQAFGRLTGAFEELFNLFWRSYLDETGDEEILETVQPFYAWRGLVCASPIWYPNLPKDVRSKLFSFVKKVLDLEIFRLEDVNQYLKIEN